ncbi:MAG: MBOAT family protein [Clostridiales bacterium]|nr:MBOAT family protein [Clostridiales bacterium]
MAITSLVFLLFVFGVMLVYYIAPSKYQWIVLLAASIFFYLSCGTWGIFFVLITATSVYFAAQKIGAITEGQKAYFKENKDTLSRDDKKIIKSKNTKKRRLILILTLILNFGILCAFKYVDVYWDLALFSANAVFKLLGLRTINGNFSIIAPLGLSFYTFQAIGYLVDVYWDNCKPEKNYLKNLLFVSFFPQVTQGPISDYSQLSAELFSKHKFDYDHFTRGFQRMLWGFGKKMVIADFIAPYVQNVFHNYGSYTGISTLIGAFLYSLQIYTDFSGYMDIMCGVCEMFGIRLTENFERPYFSKSIAEYWRRWHITLGAWFKKYIYYTIGMSGWSRKLGQKSKEKFGKFVGQTIPPSVALVVVWLATGVWHGATGAYVAWGAVNGLFIIFSIWMEPNYTRLKNKLHIRESNFWWRLFQVVRTFTLVTFIKVLPEVGTLREGFGLIFHIFRDHTLPATAAQLFPFAESFTLKTFFVLLLSVLLFVHSLLERKNDVRDLFGKLPLIVRIVMLSLLLIVIAYVGIPASNEGGFLYAKF